MASLANVTQYISAGFQRLDFHRLDTNGLPAGVTGVITPGAAGAAAGRILAAKTANVNIPAATAVPVTGDNVLQGAFIFPNETPRSFDIDFAADDFLDRAAFQNIKTRNIGNLSFAGRDIAPFSLNNIMILGVSNASSKMSGSSGLGMYAGVFATRAQMTVRGRNSFAERAAASYLGTVVLNLQDAYPWGETFQIGNEGYTQSFVEDWTHAYPVTVHRWQQTGALTKFFLGETPASVLIGDNLIYVLDANGIPTRQTTGVTVSAVDNSITFSVAPAASSDVIAFYGYVPS